MNADFSDYTGRQSARDAEYLAAWEKLTPEERAAMAAAGVRGPHCAHSSKSVRCRFAAAGMKATDDDGAGRESLGGSDDATSLYNNSAALSMRVVTASELPEELAERFGMVLPERERAAFIVWHAQQVWEEVQRENAVLLRRLIGLFLEPGNLRIRVHALAHAARMAVAMGIRSMRHSAEMIREDGEEATVESVRKVAWRWVTLLDLPPLEGAKSDEAREAYRKDKLSNKHWRKQKCTLENLKKLKRTWALNRK